MDRPLSRKHAKAPERGGWHHPSLSDYFCGLHGLADDAADGVGGGTLHSFRGMGVGAEGKARVVVAQRTGQRLDVHAVLEGQRGEGVSEVVKPDVLRADGLQDLLMGVPKGIRVEHGAGLGRHKQARTVWVLCVLLCQQLHRPLRNGQLADGIGRLGLADHQFTVDTVALLSQETNPLTVEVRMEVETGEVKEHPTYKRIQEYVQEKYGLKVHTAYIAEAKRMVGLDMRKAPNTVEQRNLLLGHNSPEIWEQIYIFSIGQTIVQTWSIVMSFCTTRFHLSTEICNIRLPHPIFSGLNMDAEESKGQIPIRHKRRVKSYLKFTFFAARYNQTKTAISVSSSSLRWRIFIRGYVLHLRCFGS